MAESGPRSFGGSHRDAGAPLKVLWLTPNICGSSGGPTSTLINGLIAERAAGINSSLASTRVPGGADEKDALVRLKEAGVQVDLSLGVGPKGPATAWGLSASLVLKLATGIQRYNVVNLQYVWCLTTLVGALLASWRGVPIVLTPHESLTTYDIEKASRSWSKKLLKRLLRPLILNATDALVLMSTLEVRDTEARGVPVFLVPHAVDGPKPERSAIQTTAPPGERELRIGFIGRNIPKKGIDRLIRAIGLSNKQSWTLLVAGPPAKEKLQSHYRKLSENMGIEDQVRWLGFVNDRDSFLLSLDILVMPSEYEGFGMAAAEAMAAGVPVVVPRQSGISALVEQYGGGVVVERPEPDQLLGAIAKLTEDPETLDHKSREARSAIKAEHSFETFAKRMQQVYSEVTSFPSSPS